VGVGVIYKRELRPNWTTRARSWLRRRTPASCCSTCFFSSSQKERDEIVALLQARLAVLSSADVSSVPASTDADDDGDEEVRALRRKVRQLERALAQSQNALKRCVRARCIALTGVRRTVSMPNKRV
jgi:hypothetical protein